VVPAAVSTAKDSDAIVAWHWKLLRTYAKKHGIDPEAPAFVAQLARHFHMSDDTLYAIIRDVVPGRRQWTGGVSNVTTVTSVTD
jgi:hypothetical protein